MLELSLGQTNIFPFNVRNSKKVSITQLERKQPPGFRVSGNQTGKHVMANNLFISYDLFVPGQSYDKVAEAIKSLGTWAKIQMSFWYVKSNHSANKAAEIIWATMDANDSLIVVDATNNNAFWYNLKPEVSKFIQDHWQT